MSIHDTQTATHRTTGVGDDGAAQPWTVWVWQDTVVGIWPAGMQAPPQQAELMVRLSRCPVVTYAVDRVLGRPTMGADVPRPADLGWVEVGRFSAGPVPGVRQGLAPTA